MQATDTFTNIISAHLKSVADSDSLFTETLKKANKNITDCITYILNEVKKSGKNGFADEEIFGMAVHYYDEDNLTVGKPVSGKVVVNHHVDAPEKQIQKIAAGRTGDLKTKSSGKAKSEQSSSTQIALFS